MNFQLPFRLDCRYLFTNVKMGWIWAIVRPNEVFFHFGSIGIGISPTIYPFSRQTVYFSTKNKCIWLFSLRKAVPFVRILLATSTQFPHKKCLSNVKGKIIANYHWINWPSQNRMRKHPSLVPSITVNKWHIAIVNISSHRAKYRTINQDADPDSVKRPPERFIFGSIPITHHHHHHHQSFDRPNPACLWIQVWIHSISHAHRTTFISTNDLSCIYRRTIKWNGGKWTEMCVTLQDEMRMNSKTKLSFIIVRALAECRIHFRHFAPP